MEKFIYFEGLTYRGLMLLRILGNGMPSLSQMEFAQSIVELIAENSEMNKKVAAIFTKYETQSRESLQRDMIFLRGYKQQA